MRLAHAMQRMLRSPKALALVLIASIAGFELLHRVLLIPQLISAFVISLALVPILLWAIILTIAVVLRDPDNLGHTIRYAFGFVGLTILLFALLYTELGITDSSTGAEVNGFWVCFYFSATTITTLGYGDFVPTDEARLIAAVEALSGLVILGMITALTFFLIGHRSGRAREEADDSLP